MSRKNETKIVKITHIEPVLEYRVFPLTFFFAPFPIVSNGGGTQTFHLRASSEVERQRWVTALELAKAKAIQRMESEDDESIMGGK